MYLVIQFIVVMEYKKFRDALQEESMYPTSENIYNYIISGEQIKLKKNEILIDYNTINPDIYFILDGILRGSIINPDGSERTYGFGVCGTMIYSLQCYVSNQPSILCLSSCSPSTLIQIKKEDFDRHINEDHEFCRWTMGHFSKSLSYKELRSEGLNGDALYKYKWLMEKRPEIIESVPDKIIASYLNITEVHLSRTKQKLLEESK